MNKKYLLGIIIVLATVALVAVVLKPPVQEAETQSTKIPTADYKNISYIINGQSVTLTDGLGEAELAPDSVMKSTTRYFGNEIRHDLNDDGHEDVVFLLTQDQGGSGIFFYVVAALYTPSGYVGSQAFFLGDRIAPQSINIDEGTTTRGTARENVLVVNFATRGQDEPLTNTPTIGKSVWIKLGPTTMQFGEVVPNFEGESR